MAVIKNVDRVANYVKLDHVLVSCTNKIGLVSNEGMGKDFPEDGLLGFLSRTNPNITFISTGNTYSLINHATNLNVIEMSEYTGYPEMKTGLVKSLHPKIHAGILAHVYTPEDYEFLQENEIPTIDAVIVNFYDLKSKIDDNADFESLRQAIDIGGPTMCHASRKAFLSTAIIVDPNQYPDFISHLSKENGSVSLEYRLQLAKEASSSFTSLMNDVNTIFQNAKYSDLQEAYQIE